MTSQRKLKANRRNARASTGPRSAAGKARSARNAQRHGLAVPIWSDPKLADDAENLARQIAGSNASARKLALAGRVAEAHIDAIRIRQIRNDLLAPGFTSSTYWPQGGKVSTKPPTRKLLELMHGPPVPEKLSLVIADLSQELDKFDRYERRALSRRKFAIRDFNLACSQGGTADQLAEKSRE